MLGTKLVPRWALWASILVPGFAPRGPTWEGLGLDVATFSLLKSGCGWAGGVTRSAKNFLIKNQCKTSCKHTFPILIHESSISFFFFPHHFEIEYCSNYCWILSKFDVMLDKGSNLSSPLRRWWPRAPYAHPIRILGDGG